MGGKSLAAGHGLFQLAGCYWSQMSTVEMQAMMAEVANLMSRMVEVSQTSLGQELKKVVKL